MLTLIAGVDLERVGGDGHRRRVVELGPVTQPLVLLTRAEASVVLARVRAETARRLEVEWN